MAQTNRISAKMKKQYRIENENGTVHVHYPVYVNIEKDDRFDVEATEHCLHIKNSKVNVSLWKDVTNVHVTVYP